MHEISQTRRYLAALDARSDRMSEARTRPTDLSDAPSGTG